MMPGWIQLGAVWLPLPHILNAIPVQWTWAYQTGATGTLISIVALSGGLAAFARFAAARLSSPVTGLAMAAAILLNPNVLYLQSTPMTEALLFGLSMAAVAAVGSWLDQPDRSRTRWAGLVLVALVLTRYEGWFVAAALVSLGLLARPRLAWRLALFPAAAVVVFLLHSFGSTGEWFVASGFFEPTNPARGDVARAWAQVVEGAELLSHPWLLNAGALGLAGLLLAAWHRRREGPPAIARELLPLALLGVVALPLYAFWSGHPTRVRYMVAFVVALTGTAAWTVRLLPARVRGAAAVAALAALTRAVPPLDGQAAMVVEAQWERPHSDGRRPVTAALASHWDGTPVMASMGSLAHYLQQTSTAGFQLEDFLHEGNGDIWKAAIVSPAPYVRWILIEESAEGGDVIAQRARSTPGYLERFERIAEGGGVALYRRR